LVSQYNINYVSTGNQPNNLNAQLDINMFLTIIQQLFNK